MKIGDTAPDFEAQTTEGRIRFHDWIGDSWAVLFSHPKDFTPVCTTELGYMAKIKPQFDRRNVKIIGLSVDSTGDHEGWAKDIEETQGHAPNYPIIGDADFNVAKLYGMLPADTEGDAKSRKPADNATVRNVYVIGPDKKIKLILVYPMTTGGNFDEVLRVIDSLQLAARRGCYYRRICIRRRGEAALPARLEGAEAISTNRPAAAITARHSKRNRGCNAAAEDGEARLSIPQHYFTAAPRILRVRCATLRMTIAVPRRTSQRKIPPDSAENNSATVRKVSDDEPATLAAAQRTLLLIRQRTQQGQWLHTC